MGWALVGLVVGATGGGLVRAQAVADGTIEQEAAVVVRATPLAAPSTTVDLGASAAPGTDGWVPLAESVPDFRVDSAGGGSFGALFSLRGLSNTPYFSGPAVTVYLDDIPLGSSFGYPADLAGFSTAVVYPGAQGSAFGRAGEGGVVVLELPEAGPQAAGDLRLGVGNYQARSAAIDASGASGAIDATVAAAYSERTGYITNTQLGIPVDTEKHLDGIARVRWHPSASALVELEAVAERARDGAQPLVPLGGPFWTVSRAQEGESDTTLGGAALKASAVTPAGLLSSVTSATDARVGPYADWLVLPPPLASYLSQSQSEFNEEIRLRSAEPGRDETGLASVTYSAGLWLSDETTAGATDRSILGLVPIEVSQYGYVVRDGALFGEVGFAPAGLWRVSLGLRLERRQERYHQEEEVPTAGLDYRFSNESSGLLPKITASRALGHALIARVSGSVGAKPGGYAAYTDKVPYIPFASERAAGVDAGLDAALFRGALTVSADAFATAITNLQIERSFSATDYFVATAPRAHAEGAEISARWNLPYGFFANASGGVTDVVLDRFLDPVTGGSFAGKRAPYAPAFTADLRLGYKAGRHWFAGAELSATGRTYYTEGEDPAFAQPAYAVLSARAGYEEAHWSLSVYGANLTDRGYYTLIIPGVGSGSPGAPRTLGVEWKLRY